MGVKMESKVRAQGLMGSLQRLIKNRSRKLAAWSPADADADDFSQELARRYLEVSPKDDALGNHLICRRYLDLVKAQTRRKRSMAQHQLLSSQEERTSPDPIHTVVVAEALSILRKTLPEEDLAELSAFAMADPVRSRPRRSAVLDRAKAALEAHGIHGYA